MVTDDSLRKRKRLWIVCFCFLTVWLLTVVVSSHLVDTTQRPTTPSTSTHETNAPTEPSIFAGYKVAFGENSMQSALNAADLTALTTQDKQAIQQAMTAMGGSAEITDEYVKISYDKQSIIFYMDKTQILIDAEGNSGGTRWIKSPLSELILPLDGYTIGMCLSTNDSFAVKYSCDKPEQYAGYLDAMLEIGWTEISRTDIIFTAENSAGNLLTVTYSDHVLTIVVDRTPKTLT